MKTSKALALLLSIAMVLSLAACGSAVATAPATEATGDLSAYENCYFTNHFSAEDPSKIVQN